MTGNEIANEAVRQVLIVLAIVISLSVGLGFGVAWILHHFHLFGVS